MPTFEKRNFYGGTVTHPGTSAISLAALLRLGGWGLNAAGDAASMDSFTGDNVQFIPTTNAYVGFDNTTDNTGVLAAAGLPFNVTDYCRGVVATDDVFVYSLAANAIQIVFQSI